MFYHDMLLFNCMDRLDYIGCCPRDWYILKNYYGVTTGGDRVFNCRRVAALLITYANSLCFASLQPN